ncbi:hypothetical protein ACJ41O_009338 [Fusarium nematophilum]
MLPSPHRSPEPAALSRSVSEGPPRSAPKLGLQPCPEQAGCHPADRVSLSLARAVVNMQEHYASELEAEKQKTDLLVVQNDELRQRMDVVENRLQMHVVLMDGFVSFMREVKEGRFANMAAEMSIARHLGGDHVETVQSLVSDTWRLPCTQEGIQHSVEDTPSETGSFEDQLEAQDGLEQVESRWTIASEDMFNQLPPTPTMDTPPVRSTGRRAPKRRNPPLRERRQPRRRAMGMPRRHAFLDTDAKALGRLNPQLERGHGLKDPTRRRAGSIRQRRVDRSTLSGSEHSSTSSKASPTRTPENSTPASSSTPESTTQAWTPINTTALSEPDQDPSPDYEPDYNSLDEDKQDDQDSATHKPRYSVPRSVAYRHAFGPPGKPFKYHRMPKTVALVWAEYKHGMHGNPPIEDLEAQHGTLWRLGTLQERKYASNYVGVRQKIVRKVEEMARGEGIGVEEACGRLDEVVDGRMQLLIAALRKGEDPLRVIKKRGR